jgi:hypothetical protein
MGQGRENARLFLKEHTDIRSKIDVAARKKLGLPTGEAPSASAPNGAEKQDKDKQEKPAAVAPQAQAAVAAGGNRGASAPVKGR